MSNIDIYEQQLLELENLCNQWKKQRKKIVFTNGVFDILHRGHVHYLNLSKSKGDILIVAINSDKSVKQLNKSPQRPLNKEKDRLFIIKNLKSVDSCLIFDDVTPLEVIKRLNPDILVKGGDYDPLTRDKEDKKYIVGSDIVMNNGGQVLTIDLCIGFSTTSIIEKMEKGK